MTRHRDYRAEYERRIAKATSAGRSRSEARGHGAPRTGFDRRLQAVVRDIEKGRFGSATEAARRTRTPVEKLRNYLKSTGQGEKVGGRIRYSAPAGESYHVPVLSDGQLFEVNVDRANAKLAGQYMSAVGRFIRTGDARELRPFADKSIVGRDGQNYPLETDPATLQEIYTYEAVDWDEIYRRNA